MRNTIVTISDSSRTFKHDVDLLSEKHDANERIKGVVVINFPDESFRKERDQLISQMQFFERNGRDTTENTKTLMDSLDNHASRISELTHKLEKTVKTNRFLIGKSDELQETLLNAEEKIIKITREKESLARWVSAYKVAIDDYEGSLRELGIIEPAVDLVKGSELLKPHIKRVIRQIAGIRLLTKNLKPSSTSEKILITIPRLNPLD